jgi:hypothetical protein
VHDPGGVAVIADQQRSKDDRREDAGDQGCECCPVRGGDPSTLTGRHGLQAIGGPANARLTPAGAAAWLTVN